MVGVDQIGQAVHHRGRGVVEADDDSRRIAALGADDAAADAQLLRTPLAAGQAQVQLDALVGVPGAGQRDAGASGAQLERLELASGGVRVGDRRGRGARRLGREAFGVHPGQRAGARVQPTLRGRHRLAQGERGAQLVDGVDHRATTPRVAVGVARDHQHLLAEGWTITRRQAHT